MSNGQRGAASSHDRRSDSSTALDTRPAVSILLDMRARELLRILRSKGCTVSKGKGSHVKVECGRCRSVIPVHQGEDIKPGTLRAIERQLELCLGKGWLRG